MPAEDERRELWEAKATAEDYPFIRLAAGVAVMMGAEKTTAAFLKGVGSNLPAPVVLLGLVGAFMAFGGKLATEAYEWMDPAITFFDQWMPLFFVPSISAIALAPLPRGMDLVKSVALLGGSYLFTLWSSATVASFVRKQLQKMNIGGKGAKTTEQLSDAEKLARLGDAAKMWTKQAATAGAKVLASAALQSSTKDGQKLALKGAVILDQLAQSVPPPSKTPPMPTLPHVTNAIVFQTAVASLLPAVIAGDPTPMLLTPGLLLLSISLFNYAKKLPASIKMWVGPTLAAGLSMTTLMAFYGWASGATWKAGIGLYSQGAGQWLSQLIGPAVAALGFKVYSQRALLQQYSADLIITCLLMAPIQFLGGAVLGRVLGAPPLVVGSLLPAHTTLGMALGMGPLLHASQGLIVAGVTIAGTTGISTARSLLDKWQVRDPTARGLAVGIASHSLGTSALVADEPRSAAVSGLAFALKGAISVILVSLPPFRQALLLIGTGSAV